LLNSAITITVALQQDTLEAVVSIGGLSASGVTQVVSIGGHGASGVDTVRVE